MDDDRIEQELEALHKNIIFLYKKDLQEALESREYIKAQFIRTELNLYMSGENYEN